jgi:hypothetical protein
VTAEALVLGLTTSVVAEAGPASAALPRRSALANKIDWAILHLLNRERAAHGLRRSLRDARPAAIRPLSHELPGEPVFTRRISNAGYNWSWTGENIAWNSDMSLPGVVLLERLMYREALEQRSPAQHPEHPLPQRRCGRLPGPRAP